MALKGDGTVWAWGSNASGELADGTTTDRLAPVQVTWLGYPNTTGLAAVDYRLTDAIADPEGRSERFCVEKLVRLGNGFLCYDPPAESPEIGELPLPPYIHRDATGPRSEDESRYQTVYAIHTGSLAAPTAGLHYTPELLNLIKQKGVEIHDITLHIGLGTFAPVKAGEIKDHVMHSERFEIPESTAHAVQRAMDSNRRIIAVGTTATRALESVAAANAGRIIPSVSNTSIFIHPPAKFSVIGALQTNFHLPQSTLLMLISAFATPGSHEGREWMLSVYREAIANDYRFFSYGDTMLIC